MGPRLSSTLENALRDSRLRSSTRPEASAKASSNTSFARSMATVVACMTDSSRAPVSDGEKHQSGSTKPCGDAGGVHSIIQGDAASRHPLTQTLGAHGLRDVC